MRLLFFLPILFVFFLALPSFGSGCEDDTVFPPPAACTQPEKIAITVDTGVKTLQGAVDDGDLVQDWTDMKTNPANCAENYYARGVDADGAAEGCTWGIIAHGFDDNDFAYPLRMYVSGTNFIFDTSENFAGTVTFVAEDGKYGVGDLVRLGAIADCADTPLSCLSEEPNSVLMFHDDLDFWFHDLSDDGLWGLAADGYFEPIFGNSTWTNRPNTFMHKTLDRTADDVIGSGYGWMETAGTVMTNEGATGAVTFTLPDVITGMHIFFAVVANQTVLIDPNGTEQILRLTDTGGDRISSSTVGSIVHLFGLTETQWGAIESGTWADAN